MKLTRLVLCAILGCLVGGCLGEVNFGLSDHFVCTEHDDCLVDFRCVEKNGTRRCVHTSELTAMDVNSDSADTAESVDQPQDLADRLQEPIDLVRDVPDDRSDAADWVDVDDLASDSGGDQADDLGNSTLDQTSDLQGDSCEFGADGCASCTDHGQCAPTHFCATDGSCHPKLNDGQRCDCGTTNCKGFQGSPAPDAAVCKSGACIADQHAAGVNPKGHSYCAPPGSCVDRAEFGAETASVYGQDQVICEPGSGDVTIEIYICKNGTFVGPLNCDLGSKGSQCGDKVGNTPYMTGSVVGACNKFLGCYDSCVDCSPGISDENGLCFVDCGKSSGIVNPSQCQGETYCCTGAISCTALQEGTCLARRGPGETCESNAECLSGVCHYLPGSGNAPVCGCSKNDAHCGSSSLKCCNGRCIAVEANCPSYTCTLCKPPAACIEDVCWKSCPDGNCPWQQ